MALIRALRAAAFFMAMLAIATVPRASLASELKESTEKSKGKDGMYFIVSKKGPKRCFVVSMAPKSTFHVHFDFKAAKDNAQVKLELRQLPEESTPKDRFSMPPETETIKEEEGSFQFTIKQAGQYSLCAVHEQPSEGVEMRLSLDFDAGIMDDGYDEIQKKFTLDDAQISMVRLRHRAKMMSRDADYMQIMEKDYHKDVIRLSRKVIWWPILQVVILLVTGYYQLRHMKQFFQAKRLV